LWPGENEGERGPSALVVLNKCDLAPDGETVRAVQSRAMSVRVSCTTGSGIDALRREVREALTARGVDRSAQHFMFNLRQLDSLRAAKDALDRATDAAREDIGFEFPAAEMRAALGRLADLTRPVEDEVLDRIFSRFCIGK